MAARTAMDDVIPVKLVNKYALEALQEEADRRGISVAELIAAIVEDWYDDLFLEEDLRAIEEAKQEPGAAIPWEEVKKRIQKSKRVAT